MNGRDPVTWNDLLALLWLAAIGAALGLAIGWITAKVFM